MAERSQSPSTNASQRCAVELDAWRLSAGYHSRLVTTTSVRTLVSGSLGNRFDVAQTYRSYARAGHAHCLRSNCMRLPTRRSSGTDRATGRIVGGPVSVIVLSDANARWSTSTSSCMSSHRRLSVPCENREKHAQGERSATGTAPHTVALHR